MALLLPERLKLISEIRNQVKSGIANDLLTQYLTTLDEQLISDLSYMLSAGIDPVDLLAKVQLPKLKQDIISATDKLNELRQTQGEQKLIDVVNEDDYQPGQFMIGKLKSIEPPLTEAQVIDRDRVAVINRFFDYLEEQAFRSDNQAGVRIRYPVALIEQMSSSDESDDEQEEIKQPELQLKSSTESVVKSARGTPIPLRTITLPVDEEQKSEVVIRDNQQLPITVEEEKKSYEIPVVGPQLIKQPVTEIKFTERTLTQFKNQMSEDIARRQVKPRSKLPITTELIEAISQVRERYHPQSAEYNQRVVDMINSLSEKNNLNFRLRPVQELNSKGKPKKKMLFTANYNQLTETDRQFVKLYLNDWLTVDQRKLIPTVLKDVIQKTTVPDVVVAPTVNPTEIKSEISQQLPLETPLMKRIRAEFNPDQVSEQITESGDYDPLIELLQSFAETRYHNGQPTGSHRIVTRILLRKSIQRETILTTVADDNLSIGNHRITHLSAGVSPTDAVNKSQLDNLSAQAVGQPLNTINNNNPLTGDLDLRGEHNLIINEASSDQMPVTKKQLTEAVDGIQVNYVDNDTFHEAVSQSIVNSNSYTDTSVAALSSVYIKGYDKSSFDAGLNIRSAGQDIFLTNMRDVGQGPGGDSIFSQYFGIYGARRVVPNGTYMVDHQLLPYIQAVEIADERKQQAIDESKQYTDEQIVMIDIPTDQSQAITDLQQQKRNKIDTLQTIQDDHRATGHVSFLNPFDFTDSSASVLVPSYNYRDFNPGENQFVEPYLTTNVEQLRQVWQEANTLKDRVDDHDTAIADLQSQPAVDQTQIKNSTGVCSVAVTGTNQIKIKANNNDIATISCPVGQSTLPIGIATNAFQVTANQNSFSFTGTKAIIAGAQNFNSTNFSVVGPLDAVLTNNHSAQLQVACKNSLADAPVLTLQSGVAYNPVTNSRIRFSHIFNERGSNQSERSLGLASYDYRYDSDPIPQILMTYGTQNLLSPQLTPIVFNGFASYRNWSVAQIDSATNYTLVPKGWVLQKIADASTGGISQQTQDDWELTKKNTLKWLLERYTIADPNYCSLSDNIPAGLIKSLYDELSNSLSTAVTDLTTAYQSADAAVTIQYQAADSTLQAQLTAHSSQLSSLNAAVTIASNTNISQQTSINQLETDIATAQADIIELQNNQSSGSVTSQQLQAVKIGTSLANRFIGRPIMIINQSFSSGSSSSVLANINNGQQVFLPITTGYTAQWLAGNQYLPSDFLATQSSSLKINFNSIYVRLQNEIANIAECYDGCEQFELLIKMSTQLQMNMGTAANVSSGVRLYLNCDSIVNPNSSTTTMNQSSDGVTRFFSMPVSASYFTINETGFCTRSMQFDRYIAMSISCINTQAGGFLRVLNGQTTIEISIVPVFGN